MVDIRIYNLAGQEFIYLGEEALSSGSHVRDIPSGDLPSGIYVLRALISGQVYTRKMVVN